MIKTILKWFLGVWAVSAAIAAVVGVASHPDAPPSPAEKAQRDREADDYAMKSLGEQTIRAMLKDPGSGVFSQSEGRVKDGLHIACGYVNAKNSFGAMAGNAPWLVIEERKIAMIANSENGEQFRRLWNTYCVGAEDGDQPQRGPPEAFRSIKWGSPLPSKEKLQKSVLKGCASIVEQKRFTASASCSHMHIDRDSMDLYAQRVNVPPIFGVPVSEQLLTWSGRKFWSGTIYIHGFKEADLAKLRAALTAEYGPPTFSDDKVHLSRWTWADKKIDISLHFDPVAKPALGSNGPPQTSLSLSFSKTE